MGRLAPAHYDHIFLDKVKTICLKVLQKLNHDNDIKEALDLCPFSSRRSAAVPDLMRTNDDETESESSESAQRSQLSDSSEDTKATPTMPDYTFEQLAEHFEPQHSFFERIFEIVIKETARRALYCKGGTGPRIENHRIARRVQYVPNINDPAPDRPRFFIPTTGTDMQVLFSRQLQPLSSHNSEITRLLQRTTDTLATDIASSLPARTSRRQHAETLALPDPTTNLSPNAISDRLAAAYRRNVAAGRTIDSADRLARRYDASAVRNTIESLRGQLMRIHTETARQPNSSTTQSFALGCIELLEDVLRRISTRDTSRAPHVLRLWRDHLLSTSMTRQAQEQVPRVPSDDDLSPIELEAHRHLFATIQESHWARTDIGAPTSAAIRAWRRKLACWYFLDCTLQVKPLLTPQGSETPYARWTPHSELAYDIDAAGPDPVTTPHLAWAFVRHQDPSMAADLGEDVDVRAALESPAVGRALASLLQLESTRSTDTSLDRAVSLSRRNAIRDSGHRNSLLVPRPSTSRRRSSFTFVTTPAAVLRSGERRISDAGSDIGDDSGFDLGRFLMGSLTDFNAQEPSASSVHASGASTPTEARQATFEAYAQRNRVLERRRRTSDTRHH